MHPGQTITIIKAHFGGEKPDYAYSGVVMPSHDDDWLELHCEWSLPDMDVSGIRYETGGRLIEYFSPSKRYNIFRVYDRAGTVTGLYGNVTAPIVIADDGRELVWEDRWLDAVKLPDGTITILDEDEYEASGVPSSDPALDLEIRAALAELVESLRCGDWDV